MSMESLDYKMRTSNASYVVARKDVQYFPSSLSTFTPTTSRVARILLTSGSEFIDPESVKLAFRFRNQSTTDAFYPATCHPACFIKRCQLFANGQCCDDISEYARSVHLYTLLKPLEWYQNMSIEGFEAGLNPEIPNGFNTEHHQEILVRPTLIGMLNCGKTLPPQLNLVLEVEFAEPAEAARPTGNGSLDYLIENVRALASQVTLDSALLESFNRVLLSGRSLVFSYPTMHTQVTTVPAGSTSFSATAARAYTKLMAAFVTFQEDNSQNGVASLRHPGAGANGTSFLESQLQIGALQFPHNAMKDFAEHRHFLEIAAGVYDSSIRNTRLTKAEYEAFSFIAGFPVERVPKMPLSGISTRSGDLARFTFKGTEADQVDKIFIHLVSLQVVTLSGSGVSVLD
jgi:hypothetical protein